MNKNKVIILVSLLFQISVFAQNSAQDTRVKYNNENLIVDLGVGLWGTPIPVDYDMDGLMDLLMSCPDAPYKGVYLYKNIGTKKQPLFDVSVKLSDKAFQNTKASYINGQLKVIRQGTEYTSFTQTLFDKPKKIKVDSLPGAYFKKVRSNIWSYVDFNGDENQDILVGIDDWGDYGWDNAYDKDGNWTNGPLRGYVYWLENENGIYKNRGKVKAGDKVLETFGAPGPNMADFNGDGKPEIICGEFLDKLTWFNNSGSKKAPKFEKGKLLLDDMGDVFKLHVQMITPVAVDFDSDGHIDLLVGDEDGRVAFIKNTGKKRKGMPVFNAPVYLKQKADNLKFGALTAPFSVDWDGDGNDDIICGNSAGNIAFIKNADGGISPKWNAPVLIKANGNDIRIMAGKNGSIQGPAEEKWGYTTLSVADWDNDGKNDIIVNSILGEIVWYKNTDDLINLTGPYKVKVDWQSSPIPKPVWNWWNPGTTDLVTQWRTTPFAIDWNKDGLTDLIMLDYEGYLSFYERFEKDGELWLKPGKRIFYMEDLSIYDHNNNPTGINNKLLQLNSGIGGRSGRRKLCFVDWNNDGRMDLMVNSKNVCFFENMSQNGDTTCFANRGDVSEIKLAGHDTSPTPIDWDKDGVFDLLVGAEDGHFYVIKNIYKTKK
ncbi:MAG: VCBS repeat-containing protein [Paludibacter sp.]|nr:VCBS repeat-containing protein [Paludibacter sp.]